MFGKGHDYKGKKVSPMQLTILIILRDRPMYGYEVLKEMRDRFEGVWTPQTGSIYPALKRLAEHGLLVSQERDGTDYYSISPEGREWVIEELRHSPRDIRLLTRYLEVIGQASAEYDVGDGTERRPGPFSEAFDDDDSDGSKRVKKLRTAREHLAKHLADIDKELVELDPSWRARRLKDGREHIVQQLAYLNQELEELDRDESEKGEEQK
jgi:DNA-binding PadR family transcriptional regulator